MLWNIYQILMNLASRQGGSLHIWIIRGPNNKRFAPGKLFGGLTHDPAHLSYHCLSSSVRNIIFIVCSNYLFTAEYLSTGQYTFDYAI